MDAVWEIVIKTSWYWLVTIIPAVLGIIGAIQVGLPENKRGGVIMQIYNLFPFWAWLIIAAIAFVITILVGASNYIQKHKKESQQPAAIQSASQQGGMTGIVNGDLYQGGTHYHGEKITNKKNLPKTFSVSYKEKQKNAIEKISKLINVAVENSTYFSQGISRQGEPDFNEQCKRAYDSGKAMMEYFKKGNNGQYFSTTARRNITELYELISKCIYNMDIARKGNFDLKLWNEYSEKLQKIKILKDEIDIEFHEFLVNFDKRK